MFRAWTIGLGLAVALLLAGWRTADADELLANGGFEEGTAGWKATLGQLTTVPWPVHGGTASGRLAGEESQPHEVYQQVYVAPGQTYIFSGWAQWDSAAIRRLFLRLYWFDAGGLLISWDDSEYATGPNPHFAPLSTGPRPSPPGAARAWATVVVEATGPFTLYLDDFSLQGQAPVTPSPTPAPSPTPTPIPSPTAGASPTPTAPPAPPMPKPSPTPTALPGSPTPEPTPTPEPHAYPSLINGGFEEASDEEIPRGWQKVGGEMRRTALVHAEGDYAAAFSSDTQSTKWMYQTVSVIGGSWYELTALALKDDPAAQEVYLRVSWYASTDGSGRAIASADSIGRLTSDSGAFRRLTTGAIRAPESARTAKIRLMLRPRSAAPTTVYFDDVRFSPSNPPRADQPSLAETPTPEPHQATTAPTPSRGENGGGTPHPSPSTTPAVLAASTHPPTLANVKGERPSRETAASPGGDTDPAWALWLAVGVPLAALAAAGAAEWYRHRLAGDDERRL